MYQIIFTISPEEKTDYSARLFNIGASSLSFTKSDETIIIYAIFESEENVKKEFPDKPYSIRYLDEKEWKYGWISRYQPFWINDDIYIQPESNETPVPDTCGISIILDPRDAFGDGRHPTTILCMEMLYSQLYRNDKINSLLDVGAGTGILSILAEKLGVPRIDSIDSDPNAIERAVRNIKLNKCNNIRLTRSGISEYSPEGSYDIIVANLLTGILIENIEKIKALMPLQGLLIMSGVSNKWDIEMKGVISRNGLNVQQHNRRQGWNCYCCVRTIHGSS